MHDCLVRSIQHHTKESQSLSFVCFGLPLVSHVRQLSLIVFFISKRDLDALLDRGRHDFAARAASSQHQQMNNSCRTRTEQRCGASKDAEGRSWRRLTSKHVVKEHEPPRSSEP